MNPYVPFLIILFIIFHILCTRYVFFKGRGHYHNKDVHIYDVGHNILPNFSDNKILLFMKDLATLLVLCFGFGVFTEFIEYFIVILAIRHVFITATILPQTLTDPNKDLSFKYYYYLKGHCYDKIFSGHFSISILLSLILYHRGIIKNMNLLVLYNLFNAFLILSTHSHYTIDLLVSIPIVFLVYQNKIKLNIV
jgi:hypothetical protein